MERGARFRFFGSGDIPRAKSKTFFSYPDYTVGTGIAPVRRLAPFADYTAGGEFRPAPKNRFVLHIIIHAATNVK